MRATFSGLEIARTGLTVSQIGLDVTGHNIANVDTEGYTRQRIVNTAYDPNSTVGKFRPVTQALVGGGAQILVHDQIRSAFLDTQFRKEMTSYSYWSTRAQGLTYVESYFEDSAETTINDRLRDFFGAINTVSTDPVESAQRVLLQNQGLILTDTFHMAYDGLIDIQKSQDLAVKVTVDEINTIAEAIVELNKNIYSFELTGQYANDLRDKRNLLLDQLSELADVEYNETGSGYDRRLVVKIGGQELVNHNTVNKLGYTLGTNPISGEDPVAVPCWLDSNGVADPANPLTISGGKLEAYITMRDGNSQDEQGIPFFIEKLNTLARALVQTVNDQHSQGWTYPTGGNPSQTGINFFDDQSGNIMDVTAKNISLSQDVANDVTKIACSSVEVVLSAAVPPATSGQLQSGNNENMSALYDLYGRKDLSLTTPGGSVPIGGYYSYMTGIVIDVASTLGKVKDTADNRAVLLLDAENQRLSVSGVSLDEEMTNLIKYQHAYSGASRVINAMDEAVDILINRTGRVGL